MSAGSEEGGRTAMETLLQRCPDINVVYTINEPAAAGAWEALKSVGKDDGSVLVVSIDGGCPGVENVKAGIIGATSQQYPHKMASMALETIAKYGETGEKPEMKTEGLDFFDTGATLITAEPVDGVPSIGIDEGLSLCWG
jgi:fructose transport system substrate-binding protein